jgi:hypothetical protein
MRGNRQLYGTSACREQWNGAFVDFIAVYKCVYVHRFGGLDITECLGAILDLQKTNYNHHQLEKMHEMDPCCDASAHELTDDWVHECIRAIKRQSRNKDSESNAHDALLISMFNTFDVVQKQHQQYINDLSSRHPKTEVDDDTR